MGKVEQTTTSERDGPPALDELAAALKLVVRKGLPLDPDSSPEILVGLAGVQARSIDPGDHLSRVKALNALLRQLLLRLGESDEAQALAVLFGLHAEDRGQTLTERRARASRGLGYGETHFRKNVEPRLLRKLAWMLHEDSQTYAPRTRKTPPKVEIAGDTPGLMPADISEHEELVSRIWALVYELRAALIRRTLLDANTRPDAEHARTDASRTALWLVARLLNRIHDYLEHYGESILHGEAEYQVESLIRLAGWSYEFSAKDAQTLRYVLARVGDSDMERFLAARELQNMLKQTASRR